VLADHVAVWVRFFGEPPDALLVEGLPVVALKDRPYVEHAAGALERPSRCRYLHPRADRSQLDRFVFSKAVGEFVEGMFAEDRANLGASWLFGTDERFATLRIGIRSKVSVALQRDELLHRQEAHFKNTFKNSSFGLDRKSVV